jgi:hypothetical protein
MKSTDVTRPFARGPETTGKSGADGRNGATSTEADPADAARKGAHRLHTGAYPVVNEPISMRPRNEPPPEPAELFRPAGREEQRSEAGSPATPETTVTVAAGEPADGADERSLAPVPPGVDKSDDRSR